MTLKQVLLWTPSHSMRWSILLLGTLATLLVTAIHVQTGLVYEFHVFFFVPLLAVSWYVGPHFGYGLAVLTAIAWLLADRLLLGEQADIFPEIYNTAMRLTIFLVGAWLVGEMRRLLARESRLAREDSLTLLPNRREFYECGRRAFAQAQRQGSAFTAVFIDIDHFKEVNDTLGHDVGDQLLVAVAKVLRENSRSSDVPGRLGGDEFALLLPNMDAEAAISYAQKLHWQLLNVMEDHRWPATFSIGVASHSRLPEHFDQLIRHADSLMYEVKRSGRNRVLFNIPR